MNIIITGAGKGLGFALAKELLKESGHTILALSRNIEALSKLGQSGLSGAMRLSDLIPYRFDLTTGSYEELLAFSRLHFDTVDVLVNNAGLLIVKPFAELDDKDFDTMFDTNVKAVVRTVRTLLPMMHSATHIVNISSMGGFQGSAKFAGLSLYSAGKGAVSILTECLAEEFKDRGIRVNALALGSVQTEMLAEAFPGYQAALTAEQMAVFVKDFALRSGLVFNGKVLPVSQTTP